MRNGARTATGGGAQRSRYVVRPAVEWRVLALLGILVLLFVFFRPLITVVILFALGLLLAAALHPALNWVQERVRLPRGAIAAILAVTLLLCTAALLWWIVPILLNQVIELARQAPSAYVDLRRAAAAFARRNPALAEYAMRQVEAAQIQRILATVVAQVGVLGVSFASALAAGGLVLVVALYSLVHPTPLVSGLLSLRPPEERERVAQSVTASLHRIRAWMWGTLAAMASVGVASALALWLLGVPYALLFGVLAGLLEVVPTLGPILAAMPPMFVALLQEPIRALWVALAFVVIQQLENHLLIPVLMGGALRVHPVLILFGILVMGSLFGLLGVFLAVPLIAVAQAVVEELHRPPDREREATQERARSALEMTHAPGQGSPARQEGSHPDRPSDVD